MEEVARDDDGIRGRSNDTVYGSAESLGDIGLPLVDAANSLPVILPDSEVRIGDMGQFHGWRIPLPHCHGQRPWTGPRALCSI
jgi:hypothetical protein